MRDAELAKVLYAGSMGMDSYVAEGRATDATFWGPDDWLNGRIDRELECDA